MRAPDRPSRPLPQHLDGGLASIVPHRVQDDPVDPGDASPDPEELRRKLLALARALARQMADTDHKAMIARMAARSVERKKTGPPKAKAPRA